jgi:Phage tail lysozyme
MSRYSLPTDIMNLYGLNENQGGQSQSSGDQDVYAKGRDALYGGGQMGNMMGAANMMGATNMMGGFGGMGFSHGGSVDALLNHYRRAYKSGGHPPFDKGFDYNPSMQMYYDLINSGKMTPQAAAGYVGNFSHEANMKGALDPAAVEMNKPANTAGIGMAQWTNNRINGHISPDIGRRHDLETYAAGAGKPWQDQNVQTGFFNQERQDNDWVRKQDLKVQSQPDIQSATSAVGKYYERPNPAALRESMPSRQAFAQGVDQRANGWTNGTIFQNYQTPNTSQNVVAQIKQDAAPPQTMMASNIAGGKPAGLGNPIQPAGMSDGAPGMDRANAAVAPDSNNVPLPPSRPAEFGPSNIDWKPPLEIQHQDHPDMDASVDFGPDSGGADSALDDLSDMYRGGRIGFSDGGVPDEKSQEEFLKRELAGSAPQYVPENDFPARAANAVETADRYVSKLDGSAPRSASEILQSAIPADPNQVSKDAMAQWRGGDRMGAVETMMSMPQTGMFIGPKATGYNHAAAERAQQLKDGTATGEHWSGGAGQGDLFNDLQSGPIGPQTPRDVTAQTGMHEWNPGDWWGEISDKDAKYNYDAALNAHASKIRNEFIAADPSKANDPNYALDRIAQSARRQGWQTTVGAVLDHPELYDNYGHLRDTPLRFLPEQPNGANWNGAYTPSKNLIEINPRMAASAEEQRSTLLHELMHGIQTHEGRYNGIKAKGVVQNPAWKRWDTMAKSDPVLMGYLEHERSPEVRDALNTMFDNYRREHPSQPLGSWNPHYREYFANATQQDPALRQLQAYKDQLDYMGVPLREPPKKLDKHSSYAQDSAETQARNVQSRMGMDEAELAANHPRDTLRDSSHAAKPMRYDDIVWRDKKGVLRGGGPKDERVYSDNGIETWHGSPYVFDEFNLDHIGRGSGAQAYGHGVYTADDPNIARGYRASLSLSPGDRRRFGEAPIRDVHEAILNRADNVPIDKAQKYYDRAAALEEYMYRGDPIAVRDAAEAGQLSPDAAKWLERVGGRLQSPGGLYRLRVNADPAKFLDYHGTMAMNDPLRERLDALSTAGLQSGDEWGFKEARKAHDAVRNPELTGGDYYDALQRLLGTSDEAQAAAGTPKGIHRQDAAASKFLSDSGVPGNVIHEYHDDPPNRVIFDPRLIDILKRYRDGGRVGFAEGGVPDERSQEEFLKKELAGSLPQSNEAEGLRTGERLGLMAGAFAPGSGVASASGYYPSVDHPSGFEPSAKQDWNEGRYFDAGVKAAGALGDAAYAAPVVGPAIGGALKAPMAMKAAMAIAPAARGAGKLAKAAQEGAAEEKMAAGAADAAGSAASAAPASDGLVFKPAAPRIIRPEEMSTQTIRNVLEGNGYENIPSSAGFHHLLDQPAQFRTFSQLRDEFQNALDAHFALSPKDKARHSREVADQVREMIGEGSSGKPLSLTSQNAKLQKAGKEALDWDGVGVETNGVSLSPALRWGRLKTCANDPACIKECIGKTANQAYMQGGGEDIYGLLNEEKGTHNVPRVNQLARSILMFQRPDLFATRLSDQIAGHKGMAASEGNMLGMRLNTYSDLPIDVWAPFMRAHPDVQFYDYTKLKNTLKPGVHPDNYHLTYSSTGGSSDHVYNPNQNWSGHMGMEDRLRRGDNVAMVFSHGDALPNILHSEETGRSYRVISGDDHDFRPLDQQPKGEEGVVIGLKNKNTRTKKRTDVRANHVDSGGFSTEFDPKYQRQPQREITRGPRKGTMVDGDLMRDDNGDLIQTNFEAVMPDQRKYRKVQQTYRKGGAVKYEHFMQRFHNHDHYADTGRTTHPEWYEIDQDQGKA